MNRGRTAASFGEQLAVLILCVAVVAGPMYLGGTDARARFAIEAAAAAAAILWAVSGNRRVSLLALPCAICLAAMLQLMPVPDWLLVQVAPVSAGAWKLALLNAPGEWGTVSIDPGATAVAIRRLFVGIATVAVASDMGRRLRYRRQMIIAIGLVGILILATGILLPEDQKLRQLLGFVPLDGSPGSRGVPVATPIETAGYGFLVPAEVGGFRYVTDRSDLSKGCGPYIYSNHFAGAICMTIPVTIAGWLFLSKGRIPMWASAICIAGLVTAAVWSVAVLAKSRAGAVALVIALLALGLLSAKDRISRRCMEALFAVAIGGLIAATAMMYGAAPLGIEKHLPEKLRDQMLATMQDPRVFAAQVAFRMLRASYFLGTGFDTYRLLFPRYAADDFVIYYAHNDYAQLFAETGLAGILIVASLGGIMVLRGVRFYQNVAPNARILEAGPWAAFAGIVAHSAFDWNLHVPANALLAAVIAGLAAATGLYARLIGGETGSSDGGLHPKAHQVLTPAPRRTRTLFVSQLPSFVFIATCFAVTCLLARDAESAATMKRLLAAIARAEPTHGDEDGNQVAAEALPSLISAGERMARWDPANARLAFALGQAELRICTQPMPIDAIADSLTRARRWFIAAGRLSPELTKRMTLPD